MPLDVHITHSNLLNVNSEFSQSDFNLISSVHYQNYHSVPTQTTTRCKLIFEHWFLYGHDQ